MVTRVLLALTGVGLFVVGAGVITAGNDGAVTPIEPVETLPPPPPGEQSLTTPPDKPEPVVTRGQFTNAQETQDAMRIVEQSWMWDELSRPAAIGLSAFEQSAEIITITVHFDPPASFEGHIPYTQWLVGERAPDSIPVAERPVCRSSGLRSADGVQLAESRTRLMNVVGVSVAEVTISTGSNCIMSVSFPPALPGGGPEDIVANTELFSFTYGEGYEPQPTGEGD